MKHELSTRIRNCLKAEGLDVSRPETIAALERSQILRMPDMGVKSAFELRSWLLKKGLDFKNHPHGSTKCPTCGAEFGADAMK